MKLRYIALQIDSLQEAYYGKENSFSFSFNTRFIENYLSRAVRKYKIETGQYNLFIVTLTPYEQRIKFYEYSKCVETYLQFTKEDLHQYLSIQSLENRYEYYLELLRQGYMYAFDSDYNFQPNILLSLHQQFRENGYKNEWLWKKKLFRELDLYLFFKCAFTSFDFTLSIEVYDAKQRQCKLNKVIFRTGPDEIFFSKNIRNLIVDKDNIIITDFLDYPFLSISLNDLCKGIIRVNDYGNNLLLRYQNLINKITW